jgi:hypothetical protein
VASGSGLAAVTGISGSTPTRRDLPGGSADRPRAVSPDGRLVADVDGAGAVRIHDLAAAAAPRSLAPARTGEQTGGLVFSPDGARLGQVVTRPAGAAALRVLDVATGAVVAPELALPGDRPGAWLTSDPDRAVVRSAWDAPAEVRSLIDGAVLSTLPVGAGIALDGDAVVTCQRADAAGSLSDAVATLTPLAGGAAERQVRATGSCVQLMLTADGAALVAVSGPSPVADQVLLRVTDLHDGRAVQITAPPFDRTSTSRGFPVLPAALVAGPGGRPDLLVRSGRALLRLRGDAAPGAVGTGQPDRSLDSSRRFLVGSTDTAITVEDRATATPLASMPRPAGTDTWAVADDLWIVVPDAGGWRLDRHQLPTLRLLSSYPLPTGPEKPVLWTPDGSDPGPGVGLAGGRLVAFDLASGQPLGAGAAVDARGAERDSTAQLFWGRPGHPGEALVFTRSSHFQLWDAVAGRQLVDIDFVAGILAGQGHVAAAFDPTGRRLVLGNGKTATEYDADTGEPVRDPVPLSADGHVAGFAADGFLVAYAPDRSVALIDLERGRESGSAKPVDPPLVQEVAAGGGWLAGAGSDGVLPVEVPLTARAWFDEVCAASGARPFTPAELAILPAGVSQDPPCS